MARAKATGPQVRLENVATELGVPYGVVASIASVEGYAVGEDWSGRTTISETDARSLIVLRRSSEDWHLEQLRAVDAAHRNWVADRERVIQEAEAAELDRLREVEQAHREAIATEGSGGETGKGWASEAPDGRRAFPVATTASPQVRELARTAARKALADWERSNPEPGLS